MRVGVGTWSSGTGAGRDRQRSRRDEDAVPERTWPTHRKILRPGIRPNPSDARKPWLTVSRPVGGVLCARRRGGHPSERPTWGLSPERRAGNPCPTLGLAPGGVCRAGRVAPAAGALLPHRFTLACTGLHPPSAVFSLLHFPAGHPDWPLASTLPCGAPTFLDAVPADGSHAAATRPTHRLAHSARPSDLSGYRPLASPSYRANRRVAAQPCR